MKNTLKFCLLLCASILIGCNSDDDNSQPNNLISEFKINGNTSYATPNGYYSQYTEVAQIVVESFYQKNNSVLLKHTIPESYNSFISIQDMMTTGESGASNFTVIQEMVEEEIA